MTFAPQILEKTNVQKTKGAQTYHTTISDGVDRKRRKCEAGSLFTVNHFAGPAPGSASRPTVGARDPFFVQYDKCADCAAADDAVAARVTISAPKSDTTPFRCVAPATMETGKPSCIPAGVGFFLFCVV